MLCLSTLHNVKFIHQLWKGWNFTPKLNIWFCIFLNELYSHRSLIVLFSTIISDMPLEQLHNWLCDVRRSAISQENGSTQTCTLLKFWHDLTAQNTFIPSTIYGTGNRTNLPEKNGPTIYDAVKPHRTVTFGECICADGVSNSFSFAHILQFVYWQTRGCENRLHMSMKFSMAIHWLPCEREIPEQTLLFLAGHQKATPEHVSFCMDSNAGYCV